MVRGKPSITEVCRYCKSVRKLSYTVRDHTLPLNEAIYCGDDINGYWTMKFTNEHKNCVHHFWVVVRE